MYDCNPKAQTKPNSSRLTSPKSAERPQAGPGEARAAGRGGLSGALAGHEALQSAAGGRQLDGRVRRLTEFGLGMC